MVTGLWLLSTVRVLLKHLSNDGKSSKYLGRADLKSGIKHSLPPPLRPPLMPDLALTQSVFPKYNFQLRNEFAPYTTEEVSTQDWISTLPKICH